jgi:hypothetical protein
MLKTAFWRKAAQSLPASVRSRHLASMERAERWELAFDRAIEGWSRARAALGRAFNTPAANH